jgi:hypothetical protein
MFYLFKVNFPAVLCVHRGLRSDFFHLLSAWHFVCICRAHRICYTTHTSHSLCQVIIYNICTLLELSGVLLLTVTVKVKVGPVLN